MFIFHIFGIIAGAGIMITEVLHHFLTSRQLRSRQEMNDPTHSLNKPLRREVST